MASSATLLLLSSSSLLLLLVLCKLDSCTAETASPHRPVARIEYNIHGNEAKIFPASSYHRGGRGGWGERAARRPTLPDRHSRPAFPREASATHFRRNRPLVSAANHETKQITTGLYKSYGRGHALVTRPGQVVTVSNSIRQPKVHKGTITAKILNNPTRDVMSRKRMQRARDDCFGCPRDRVVIASRGNTFVTLPEPCPTSRWVPISGPRPGMKIQEGVHTLIGRTTQRSGEICRYRYEVRVLRCSAFRVDDAAVECTADNAWGSVCTVSCNEGRELDGEAVTECREDLKWSNPPPVCRVDRGCPMPQTPDDGKIQCHVPNEADLESDLVPQNTYCRYKSDGKQRLIVCKEGYWVKKHAKRPKHVKFHRRNGTNRV